MYLAIDMTHNPKAEVKNFNIRDLDPIFFVGSSYSEDVLKLTIMDYVKAHPNSSVAVFNLVGLVEPFGEGSWIYRNMR